MAELFICFVRDPFETLIPGAGDNQGVSLAQIATLVFAILSWGLAFGWLYQLVQWLLNIDKVDDLRRIYLPVSPSATSSDSPQLTVIVPACNEESSIAATLRSLLSSVEISVQIIAVNDRSTDRTGEIMQALLEEFNSSTLNNHSNKSLEVIHINDLPCDWLGKPHALATAFGRAGAEWILCTDGDVLFAPNALSKAFRYALNERVDHLVVMPDWTLESPGEAAMHGALHALSTWTMRLWKVPDPQAKDFLGVGAFNMMRRSTLEAIGGFAVLRMEVLEDLRLGWLVKRAGFRSRVALGRDLVSVRWSDSAMGVVRNLEKNLFALYRYKTGLALFACLGLLVQIVWPLIALWVGGWARWAAITQYAAILGIYLASHRVTRVPFQYVVAFPFAAGLFLFAHLRSIFLALSRGGVVWRGTLYSLKQLRSHAGPMW